MRLTQIIEALLFASDAPLSAADLSRVDERLDEDTVEAVIQELRAEYELSERSFQIYEVAGGFQLLTRPEFVSVLERYESVPQASRLSAPALEVLAIIAYRQPLGRAEIEDIRGVGSSGVLKTLQERHLVEPVARGEGLGRPLLYGTTSKFLEHFGFRSLEDLPRPDELPVVLRDRTLVRTLPLEEEPVASAPEATAASTATAASEATAAEAVAEQIASEEEVATEEVATDPLDDEVAPGIEPEDRAGGEVAADDAPSDGSEDTIDAEERDDAPSDRADDTIDADERDDIVDAELDEVSPHR